MSGVVAIWTVYDHPRDWPTFYVARRHDVSAAGPVASNAVILERDLERLRTLLENRGLTRLPRDPADDPVIVESWL